MTSMAVAQLTEEEVATVRALRYDAELSYDGIAKQLNASKSAVFRLLTKPGYQFEELTVIRMRKAIQRIRDSKTRKTRRAVEARA